MVRLRCEACGGTAFAKADGSYRCMGCGRRYNIDELRGLVEGSDGGVDERSPDGGGEPSSGSVGNGPVPANDAWSAGREDVGAGGHGQYVRTEPARGSVREGRPTLLDAHPAGVMLLVGVAVFALCYVFRRLDLGLRVIGMSPQEWLLFFYNVLLLATLARRDTLPMRVLAIACSILTIVVLCLQVWAWEERGSFSLLELPGSTSAQVADDRGDEAGDNDAGGGTETLGSAEGTDG